MFVPLICILFDADVYTLPLVSDNAILVSFTSYVYVTCVFVLFSLTVIVPFPAATGVIVSILFVIEHVAYAGFDDKHESAPYPSPLIVIDLGLPPTYRSPLVSDNISVAVSTFIFSPLLAATCRFTYFLGAVSITITFSFCFIVSVLIKIVIFFYDYYS